MMTVTKCLSFPSENIKIQLLWETYTLIMCLVLILVVTSGVILSLKNKYDISAHLISKCQLVKDKCSDLIFPSFTELLPMFAQASRILKKHYCRSATQIQYVPFSSLLKQLFLHVWLHWWCPWEARDSPCSYSHFLICSILYWMSNPMYSASSKLRNQNLWTPLMGMSSVVFPAPHRAPTAPGAQTASAQRTWSSRRCWAGAHPTKRGASRTPLRRPSKHLGRLSLSGTVRERGLCSEWTNRRRLTSQCPVFIRFSLCRNSEGQRPSFGCSNLGHRSSEKHGWASDKFVTVKICRLRCRVYLRNKVCYATSNNEPTRPECIFLFSFLYVLPYSILSIYHKLLLTDKMPTPTALDFHK